MAAKAKKNVTGYEITVTANPNFVGIGAGGVQFAYGKALVTAESTIVEWYRGHEGYEVKEITEEEPVKETAKE